MDTKVKNIFMLIIIFIIVLICFLVIKLYVSSTSHQVSYIYDDRIYDDSLIYPSHIYIISNNYDGDLSLNVINKSINYFCTNVVSEVYSQFGINHSDGEIRDFYNKNKKNIQLVSGIIEYDEFYKLVNTIIQKDSANPILKRIEIDTEDFGFDETQFYCNLIAYYDNDIELPLYITIDESITNKNISPIHYFIK